MLVEVTMKNERGNRKKADGSQARKGVVELWVLQNQTGPPAQAASCLLTDQAEGELTFFESLISPVAFQLHPRVSALCAFRTRGPS
jgi:hypothetical protein